MSSFSHSTFVVRHGYAQWDATDSDPPLLTDLVPLADRGQERLQLCLEHLAGKGVERVVSSPLTRALQLAHILATGLNVPLAVDVRLREWIADIASSGAPGHQDFQNAFGSLLKHGGEWPAGHPQAWEPLSGIRHRAHEALAEHCSAPVVVVTHGILIYAVTGMDVSPGGVVEVVRTARGAVELAGDGVRLFCRRADLGSLPGRAHGDVTEGEVAR